MHCGAEAGTVDFALREGPRVDIWAPAATRPRRPRRLRRPRGGRDRGRARGRRRDGRDGVAATRSGVDGCGVYRRRAGGADDFRDHQRAANARHDRQARRQSVPRARPLQRAARSQDGHLGEDAREVLGRIGFPVRYRQPARARRRRHQGDAGRARQPFRCRPS